MEQKEMEKKMKAYVKHGRKAANGSRRSKKKLRKMATNDLISVIAKKATNHPAWYTKLGGELIGLNYGAIDQITPRTDLLRGQAAEPIMVRTTTDAIVIVALTATSDDTIRVAAQKIVNELRLVSGANTIYDVDDMVDYMLNIRSIWVSLTQIRRAVRCLNAMDPYDIDAWRKYLMMALDDIISQGTPVGFAEEFRQKAANIVNWLNTVVKSVRFMMPGNFTLFERTSWMFSNIFVDGTGEKFGTKMFVARSVPYYTHTAGATAHTATSKRLFGADMTVATLMSNVQSMITDFTTKVANVAIAGDLMKAYGMKSFYDPGAISYEEKPAFIYDERALEQIANADLAMDFRSNEVYQYDGVSAPLTLTYTGTAIKKSEFSTRSAVFERKFVNTEDNIIESGETLSLTRFKCTAVPTYDTNNNLTGAAIRDCGTEVIIDYLYVVGVDTSGVAPVLSVVTSITATKGLGTLSVTETIELALYLSSWTIDDYGPIAYLHVRDTSQPQPGGGVLWEAYPLFDFANWALMSRVEQQQFHKTAILSMLTPSASVVQQAVAVLH